VDPWAPLTGRIYRFEGASVGWLATTRGTAGRRTAVS